MATYEVDPKEYGLAPTQPKQYEVDPAEYGLTPQATPQAPQTQAEGEGIVSQILHAPRDIAEWVQRGGAEEALNKASQSLETGYASVADLLLPMTGAGEAIRKRATQYGKQAEEAARKTEGFSEKLGPAVTSETAAMAPKLGFDTLVGSLLPASNATKFGAMIKNVSPTIRGMFIQDMETIYSSDKPVTEKAQDAVKTFNNLALLDRMGKMFENHTTKNAVIKAAQNNPPLRAALGVLGFGVIGEAGALQEGRLMSKEEAIKTLAMALPFEAPGLVRGVKEVAPLKEEPRPSVPTPASPKVKMTGVESMKPTDETVNARLDLKKKQDESLDRLREIDAKMTQDRANFEAKFKELVAGGMSPKEANALLMPYLSEVAREATKARQEVWREAYPIEYTPQPFEAKPPAPPSEPLSPIEETRWKKPTAWEEKVNNRAAELMMEGMDKDAAEIQAIQDVEDAYRAITFETPSGKVIKPGEPLGGEETVFPEAPVREVPEVSLEKYGMLPEDLQRQAEEFRQANEPTMVSPPMEEFRLPVEQAREMTPADKADFLIRAQEAADTGRLTPDELGQIADVFERAEAEKPVPVEPAKPKTMREKVEGKGEKRTATDNSVRDMPQQATIVGDTITIQSKVGRHKAGSYKISLEEWEATQKYPNPNYAKAELIRSKTSEYDTQEGGIAQAQRIRDSQARAIDKALGASPKTWKEKLTAREEKIKAKIKAGGELSEADRATLRKAGMSEEEINQIEFRKSSVLGIEQLADYAKLGAIKMAKGAIDFAEWSKQMVDHFGEAIRPHLQMVYDLSKKHFDKQTPAVLNEWRSMKEPEKPAPVEPTPPKTVRELLAEKEVPEGTSLTTISSPPPQTRINAMLPQDYPQVNGTPKTVKEWLASKPQVYHGSPVRGLKSVNPKKAVETEGTAFFTDNPDVAEIFRYPREYGEVLWDEPRGSLIKARVDLKNPLILEGKEAQEFTDNTTKQGEIIRKAKQDGYDGVIAKNIKEGVGDNVALGTTYAVWDAKAIKTDKQLRTEWGEQKAKTWKEKLAAREEKIKAKIKAGGELSEADRATLRKAGMSEEEINQIEFRKSSVLGIEQLADYAKLGAIKMAKGAIDFAEWSKQMVDHFGEEIRPHLERVYNLSKKHFESRTPEVISQYRAMEEPAPKVAAAPSEVVSPTTQPEAPTAPKELIRPPVPEGMGAGKVQERLLRQALQADLDVNPANDALYTKKTMEEQARVALDIAKNNYEGGLRMLERKEPLPEGLQPDVLLKAVAIEMKAKHDQAAFDRLREQEWISKQTSENAQKLALSGAIVDPDDPFTAVKQVEQVRGKKLATKVAKAKLAEAEKKVKTAEQRLNARKTWLKNQAEKYRTPGYEPKKSEPIQLDAEGLRLKAEYDKAKAEWERTHTTEAEREMQAKLKKLAARKSWFKSQTEKLKTPGYEKPKGGELELDAEGRKLQAEYEAANQAYQALQNKAGGKVTPEEAKAIFELSSRAAETRTKMEEGKRRNWKKGESATPEELAFGLQAVKFQRYIDALKQGKFSAAEALRESVNNPLKAADYAASIMKMVKAAWDDSAILRQGWKPLMTNPKLWVRASFRTFSDMYKELKGEDAIDALNAQIISHPLYEKMKTAKLAIGNLEEQYNVKLPSWATKALYVSRVGRVYKASEAAFTGFQRRMRVSVFEKMLDLAEDGKRDTGEKEFLQSVGRLVNSLTARGSFGEKLEGAVPALNVAFFAPRFYKAQLDTLLHPVTVGRGAGEKGVSFAQKQAALNLVKITAGTAGVLALASAIGTAFGNDKVVEGDPRSANFGKIKIGNTRYDVTGGMSSLLVLVARMLPEWMGGGAYKSSTTGKITKLEPGFGKATRLSMALSFLGNKLSPIGQVIRDKLSGKTFDGEKFTWGKAAYDAFTPFPITNTVSLLKDEGVKNADDLQKLPPEKGARILASMFTDFFGIGTNTYGPKNQNERQRVQP